MRISISTACNPQTHFRGDRSPANLPCAIPSRRAGTVKSSPTLSTADRPLPPGQARPIRSHIPQTEKLNAFRMLKGLGTARPTFKGRPHGEDMFDEKPGRGGGDERMPAAPAIATCVVMHSDPRSSTRFGPLPICRGTMGTWSTTPCSRCMKTPKFIPNGEKTVSVGPTT